MEGIEPNDWTSTDARPAMETVGTKDYVDADGKAVIIKTAPYRFTCCICNKVFKKKMLCIQHLNVTHKVQVREVKRVQAVNDMENSRDCPHCGKHFIYRSNLYRHMRVSHGGEGIPVRTALKDVMCPLCNLNFTSITGVNRHIRVSHFYEVEVEDQVPSSKFVACHFCKMRFSDESKCVAHMSNFHYAVYNSSFDEDGLLTEYYQCSLCQAQVELLSELKEHLSNNHGKDLSTFQIEVRSDCEDEAQADGAFCCEGCQVSFKYEKEWRSHMKVQHKAFPESCCHKCGDHSFKTVYELKCHLRDVHTFDNSNDHPKRGKVRINAQYLELSTSEFRALEKVPDWLVKHGEGQLFIVLQRTT